MSLEKNTEAHSERPCDDLQLIEGVGPAYAKALYDLGVCHFADMARFKTVDALHQALRDASSSIPLSKIENAGGEHGNWLEQAHLLARQSAHGCEESGEPQQDDPLQWREHAFFTLTFERRRKGDELEWRTKIYRQQNGGAEVELSGISDAWTAWIWEHAGLPEAERPINLEPAGHTTPPPQSAPSKPEIQITSLDVKPVQSEKQVIATIRGEVVGGDKTATAVSPPLHIALLLTNTETDQSIESAFGSTHPDDAQFHSEFIIALPQVGRYQLHAIAYHPRKNATAALYEGPILNIVP